MNIFEAGIIFATPICCVIGATVCESYGISSKIAGAIIGGITGIISGWLYGMAIMFMMTLFLIIRRKSIGIQEKEKIDPKVLKFLTQKGILGIKCGILISVTAGLLLGWPYGLAFLPLNAVLTAIIATMQVKPADM